MIEQLEPGVYEDIPAEDYHQLPYVSSTFLKKFRRNPAEALIPTTQTEDMLIGNAIHTYVLEGLKVFSSQYAVMFESDLNKNTNEYKRLRAEFNLANEGRKILPAAYKGVPLMDVLQGVADSLRAHPVSSLVLQNGFREETFIWDDPETGLRCKARADHDPGARILVDLKKTADVERFRNQVADLAYDVQAGHYTNGAAAHGPEPDTFIFVAVEAEPPYPVRCGKLSAEWLRWARIEASRLVRLVGECRESGTWPAYQVPPHVNSLSALSRDDLLDTWEAPFWRQ